MKKSNLQVYLLFPAVCLLFAASNSKAAPANNIFSGTTTNSVNTDFNYVPGEGGDSGTGGIVDTVYLDAQPTVQNLANSSLLTFRFTAPTGMYFNFNANKYAGASINLTTELFGLTNAPSLAGATVSFLNSTWDLLSSYNSSASIDLITYYGKTRFTSDLSFPSGLGTFTGIEFNFTVSGISTVPVTWAGNNSTDINSLVKPQFTASANTSVDNGAILSIVPEPSALSLLAIGLAGLVTLRRSRREV